MYQFSIDEQPERIGALFIGLQPLLQLHWCKAVCRSSLRFNIPKEQLHWESQKTGINSLLSLGRWYSQSLNLCCLISVIKRCQAALGVQPATPPQQLPQRQPGLCDITQTGAGTGPWLLLCSSGEPQRVKTSLQVCSAPPGSSLGKVSSSRLCLPPLPGFLLISNI